jgi:hypothetical protein
LRYSFIKEVKSINEINFEGGFYAHPNNPEYEKYKDVSFQERYSECDYVKKTKESIFVFNTPAVHNCHGWKLGEFLAMGKAIISTRLSNELPVLLQHGKHIHYVKNEKELKQALLLLLNDVNYRNRLESGAKSYYEKYASPQAVISNIINHLK